MQKDCSPAAGRAGRLHGHRADHRHPHLFGGDQHRAAGDFAHHDSFPREPGRAAGQPRPDGGRVGRGPPAQAHPHHPRRGPSVVHGGGPGERDGPANPVAGPGHAIRARLRLLFGVTGRSLPERLRLERTHGHAVGAGLFAPGHDVIRRLGEGPMKQSEAGFSLVELLVAITLLSLVLVSVAQLNVALARRFYALSGGAARSAVVAQQVNQFTAMPFDSLKSKAGTITVNKPPLPYTRKVTVDSLSPKLRRVTIVITPLNSVFAPDTLVLQRSKPGNNPFKTP